MTMTRWHEAIGFVRNSATEAGVNWSIVGSYAIMMYGLDIVPRDLDIFVLANAAGRKSLNSILQIRTPNENPKIDSGVFFQNNFIFENGRCALEANGFSRDVNPRVFNSIVIDNLPVIHPKTFLELLNLYNFWKWPAKMLIRKEQLERVLTEKSSDFPYLDDDLFAPFDELKRRWRVTNVLGLLREKVIESKTKNRVIEKAVDYIHREFPAIWEKLHKMTIK